MKDIYTEGGYVSDEPYVSSPIIHRSECPPFTLNKSGEKTGRDPRIDHGITKKLWILSNQIETLSYLKKTAYDCLTIIICIALNHLSNAVQNSLVESTLR